MSFVNRVVVIRYKNDFQFIVRMFTNHFTLSIVSRCRLLSWVPRDYRNQWLETLSDMTQNQSHWYRCLPLNREIKIALYLSLYELISLYYIVICNLPFIYYYRWSNYYEFGVHSVAVMRCGNLERRIHVPSCML